MLNVEGRFKAQVLAHGTEENPKTGSVQFGFTVSAFEQWNGEQWVQIQPDEITGYQNLIMGKEKGNELNDTGVKCIQDSLGWAQADLNALNNGSFNRKIVQIETGFETYDGKTRLKVKYLNPENYEGHAVKAMDRAKVQELNNRYGAKLRAMMPAPAAIKRGTDLKTPTKTPTKTPVEFVQVQGRVSADQSPPTDDLSIPPDAIPPNEAPDMGPPDVPPPQATKDDAWKAVLAKYKTRAAATAPWNELLAEFKTDYSAMIARLEDETPVDAIPF